MIEVSEWIPVIAAIISGAITAIVVLTGIIMNQKYTYKELCERYVIHQIGISNLERDMQEVQSKIVGVEDCTRCDECDVPNNLNFVKVKDC